jgi:hypothetical protein
MRRLILAIGCAFVFAGPVAAQQCLHGANETPEEQARRRQALSVARVVNSIQASQPGAQQKRYLQHHELSSFVPSDSRAGWMKSVNFTPDEDVLPGWELRLEVTSEGYWFMLRDKTDPCGFAFISNTHGTIYTAEPIR